MTFGNIEIAAPLWLLLLVAIPFLFWWYRQNQNKYFANVSLSTTEGLYGADSWKVKARPLVQVLHLVALTSLIIAMARPRSVLKQENITAEGIDIMLAIDVSTSMLARDFLPDRLEASKEVATTFVKQRTHDRIGLVVFAGESFTQCPLTTDHSILNMFLGTLECGLIENGTAIGMGLANSVKRLSDSKTKSKVVILLTDGVNNSGHTQPMQAADAAKKLGIKVYTIGVGTQGQAQVTIGSLGNGKYAYGWAPVEIDEYLLQQIAKETGGQYFRATDMDELKNIYAQIDQLETTKIETTTIKRYKELFHSFVILAILLVMLEIILVNTVFKTIV
jgi:Ca-activated chloride channel family protein